jgi:hypothetical protein
MDRRVSCPGCDSSVASAEPVCPECGFALVEERLPGRSLVGLLKGSCHLPRLPSVAAVLTGLVLIAAIAVSSGPPALPGAFVPASEPISAAHAERHLAARYPRLQYADNAVIACPDRRIEPGGQARCWILPRVGLQRAVVVSLSPRGNQLEVRD